MPNLSFFIYKKETAKGVDSSSYSLTFTHTNFIPSLSPFFSLLFIQVDIKEKEWVKYRDKFKFGKFYL